MLFLHCFLDEEVYMLPPNGYEKAKQGQVYKQKIIIWPPTGI